MFPGREVPILKPQVPILGTVMHPELRSGVQSMFLEVSQLPGRVMNETTNEVSDTTERAGLL